MVLCIGSDFRCKCLRLFASNRKGGIQENKTNHCKYGYQTEAEEDTKCRRSTLGRYSRPSTSSNAPSWGGRQRARRPNSTNGSLQCPIVEEGDWEIGILLLLHPEPFGLHIGTRKPITPKISLKYSLAKCWNLDLDRHCVFPIHNYTIISPSLDIIDLLKHFYEVDDSSYLLAWHTLYSPQIMSILHRDTHTHIHTSLAWTLACV